MAGPLVYEMEIYDSSMRVQYNFVLVLPWILLLKGFHSAVNHEVTTTRLFGTAAFQTINFVKVSRSWRSSRVFKIWFFRVMLRKISGNYFHGFYRWIFGIRRGG